MGHGIFNESSAHSHGGQPSVAGGRLKIEDNRLTYRAGNRSHAITVEEEYDGFSVGCTRVTWEAWQELKAKVEKIETAQLIRGIPMQE